MELFTDPSSPSPVIRRLGILLAVLALGCYAILLASHINACAGASDSSGYWNQARLLAAGRVHVAPRTLPGLPSVPAAPYLYVPLGFKPAPDRDGLVPTYPSGLSLMILAAAPVTGWSHAGDWIICLHSLFGVVLTYALGRSFGLQPLWSAIGAAMLAASPLYLFLSLQTMSDVPALVWTTAAVLAAWRGSDDRNASRARAWWIVASGAAFALAVLVRPSNLLALVPCAAAFLAPRRPGIETMRNGLWFLLGGLPGAIFFFLHNVAAYSRVLTTGYGDVSSDFQSRLIGETLLHYAHWLPVLFTPAVVFFLALPWVGRAQVKAIAVIGAWAFVYPAFYVSYRCTHETWWYLRFLLPAAPPIIVGSLLVIRRVAGRLLARRSGSLQPTGRGRRHVASIAFCAALALVLANGIRWTCRLHALNIGSNEAVYPQTAAWLREHVPPDSVLAVMQVSGALFYYTNFTLVRWDQFDAAIFRRIAAAAKASRRPIYAALFPFETEDALRKHMPGLWTRVGSVREATLWRYDEN